MRRITRNGTRVEHNGDIETTPEVLAQLDRALALEANCYFTTQGGEHYRYTTRTPSRGISRRLEKVNPPIGATIHPDGTPVTTGDQKGTATGLYTNSLGAVFAQVTTEAGSLWNHAHLITQEGN